MAKSLPDDNIVKVYQMVLDNHRIKFQPQQGYVHVQRICFSQTVLRLRL